MLHPVRNRQIRLLQYILTPTHKLGWRVVDNPYCTEPGPDGLCGECGSGCVGECYDDPRPGFVAATCRDIYHRVSDVIWGLACMGCPKCKAAAAASHAAFLAQLQK